MAFSAKLERVLLFLTFLFFPTQLGRHFWPKFSFIFSLPIDYLSVQVYFWDLLVVALLAVWVWNKSALNRKALALLLFFILSQLLSLLKADNIGAGLVRLEQLSVIGGFGLYLASHPLASYKSLIVLGLKIGVIFESILAVIQFGLGHSVGFWILGERDFNVAQTSIAKFNWFGQLLLRPYGTFPHPNVLSAYLLLSITLLRFLDRKNVLTFLVGSLAGLLSFSRTVILLLVMEISYFLRKKVSLLFILALLFTPLFFVRFLSAFEFDYLSILRRQELSIHAWQFFLTSPFVGIGLNNFISQIAGSELISGTSRFLQPVHNIFLLSLSETGLVGLIGFLALIVYPLRILFLARQEELARLLFFCWFVIFFLGMFDHYFLTLAQGQRLFFLIWGLSLQLDLKKPHAKMIE